MSKRSPKLAEKKGAKKSSKNEIIGDEANSGGKTDVEKKKSDKDCESSKMTLCTQPPAEATRPQRRPGRPPGGKKMISREMPGKLRSAYRRSIDPCDNSNDSGLGFDQHVDPHHHTMSMSERLTWTGERAEAKRLRMDIKVENEEANDKYSFSSHTSLHCKDNVALIRTAPGGSAPSLSLSNSGGTATGRAVPRCTPVVSRQAPTAPVSLTTQLTSTSRFSDVVLTIVKQPEQQHRARYQTEGSRGAVKDREGNGFPIVQLTGYYKPAMLQVYIGTDVGKVAPHMFYQACKVSGKNSTPCAEKKIDGTCVIELALDPAKEMCATCDCVGILKERNVDVEHRFPDQLGNRSKKKSTRCRMIFRTTITHDNGNTETLQVCSQPIVCTQPPGIPEICKKSLTSCPASGGLELFVLGKNFLKDTKVFFQQYEDGRVCWEQAVVPDKEYLQQTHFVCVVPPYRTPSITEPVPVRLCVVSSGKTSEYHQFVYTPVNGTVSVHTDVHAQHAQTFKGALWNSAFHKRQQDLDMMPPPDSNLVPLATRRSSVSLPSTSDSHSPPLHPMKQEYIDENSQGSMSDSMDRYRPVSESSLDVNHDSNMSMINENSVDMMHQDSMMSHISENANEGSVEMVRQNSVSDNAVMNDDSTRPIPADKVMDLRMKFSMQDYVTTASSMVATLKSFGIDNNGPLPPQSAQSVENYLTRIESKQALKVDEESKSIPNLLTNQEAQSVFLTSPQSYESHSTIAKSEAAAIAEQIITGTTTANNSNTTLTTSLEGSISTPINTAKLNELLNTTLESHIGAAKVSPVALSNELGPPVINTRMSSPLLGQQTARSPVSLTPEAIMNTQLSPSIMCHPAGSAQPESLSAMCHVTTTNEPLLSSSISSTALLPAAVSTPDSAALLCSDPEKAVLLEAAADLFNTHKKISELTTTAPDIMSIASASTNTTTLGMETNFMPYGDMMGKQTIMSESKRDYLPLVVRDDPIDKKHEDRMIPRSFPSLTENELINLINPSCFDQGNNYHH